MKKAIFIFSAAGVTAFIFCGVCILVPRESVHAYFGSGAPTGLYIAPTSTTWTSAVISVIDIPPQSSGCFGGGGTNYFNIDQFLLADASGTIIGSSTVQQWPYNLTSTFSGLGLIPPVVDGYYRLIAREGEWAPCGISYDIWDDGGMGWFYISGGNLITKVSDPPVFSAGDLAQYLSDGATVIPERGLTEENTVVFGAILRSSLNADTLQLQVEVEPSTIAFNDQPTATSAFVSPGAKATVTSPALVDGSYHWQARVVNAAGIPSPWQTIMDPPAGVDFVVGKATSILYDFSDRSGSIGSANGATAPTHSTYGPLNVRIKLGQPSGGSVSATLVLTLDQQGTSGCVDPLYRLQGYADSNYQTIDGSEYVFGNWTDASGAPISLRDYTGIITGMASGSISPPDYYALSFGSCDFSRTVAIAAAPDASYACTADGGPFNNYCSNSDVTGQPFMTLTASAADRTGREPVVIVPGIMGSRLNAVAGGAEVWPDASAMIFSGTDAYLDALKLSPSGEAVSGAEMYASDIIRTVATAIPFVGVDFYKPLIDAFLDDGYEEGKDLFVAPYDWRLDIASSADRVGAVIQNAVIHAPGGKINIIAHSMGGLVVKAYLARASSTAFLDKLIFAGVPQLGAPAIFKDLEYGDDLGFNIFGLLSLLNPDEVKSISQNMPGVYALLPTRRYVGIEGGYVFDARNGSTAPFSFDFDQTNQFMTSDPDDFRNEGLLAAADAFHAPLDPAPVDAAAVYNLVGCQNPATIKNFVLQDGGAVDIVRGNGDGSVPVDSAMDAADGYENYFSLYAENGVDHIGLVRDRNAITLIRAIIQNATATLSLPPLGISMSSEDCLRGRSQFHNETTMELIARGMVMFGTYDAEGRHTGLNADGGIDLQIPGSSYQAIGLNSFILLPGSGAYRAVARGSSANTSSTATFEIKRYDDAASVVNTATYVGVPISSASSTATLVVTSGTPAPPLSLDPGDARTPETSIPATALLDASSSRDHDPPLITVFGIPTSVVFGATTTIAFSFVDAGTGVATSSASMNGIRLTSGETVTFSAVGMATFRFFAEDKAGNPASREYHVSVLPVGGACRGPGTEDV